MDRPDRIRWVIGGIRFALEGRIVAGHPLTFRGLNVLLEMVYDILAARDIDRESWVGCGPVTMLVARAVHAVQDSEGAIFRRYDG